ncbi:MAG: YkvA family protein [Leptolyngbya sp. BL-A-14]
MSLPLRSLYNWYRQLIANPKYRWWIIAGTLVYVLSPFDVLPDFIPFIGEIDDAVLVTLVATEVSQLLLDRVKSSKNQKSA